MTIRETISTFLSHFAPLSLVKQIFPAHKSTYAFSQATHEGKPWMNVHEVELTAEDFA